MKKINNYHLFLLIVIVFILNTILFRSIDITKAQWIPPSEAPGQDTSDIITSPLSADLDLGGYNIIGEGNVNINGNSYFGDSVGIGTINPLRNDEFHTGPVLHVSDGSPVNESLTTFDLIKISAENIGLGFSAIAASTTSAGVRGVFKGVRARGTLENPVVPQENDKVVSLLGAIYDGVDTEGTAVITTFVDGEVFNNVAPQRIAFITSTTTASNRTEKMVIKADGKVGIGTTEPENRIDSIKLHVAGDVVVSGAIIAGIASEEDGGIGNTDHIWEDDGTLTYGGNEVGNWHFAHDTTYKGNHNSTLVAGNIWMTTGYDNYFGGDVGIGTEDPNKNLHIYDIREGDYNAEIDLQSVGVAGDGSHWAMYHDSDSENLRFWHGEEDRLTITDDGNFGIGITEPEAELHLYKGDSGVAGIYSADYTTAVFENDNHSMIEIWSPSDKQGGFYFSDPEIGIMSEFVYSHGNDTFRFASHPDITSGWSTHMLIDGPTGNVGIGTTEPDFVTNGKGLHIKGSGGSNENIYLTLEAVTNNGKKWSLASSGGSGIWSGTFGILENNEDWRFQIFEGGDVKIFQDLEVVGSIGDLNLSNEGKTPNEVDGTQGSWSIQEGDENLFVINRNTGEKYEIMLNKVE